MISFPHAKINLGLHIIEKRPDNFHNLASVFYPVPCCDVLEILPSKTISFQSSGLPIPPDPKGNLCLQAYHLLSQDFALPPVQIHLHKVIPIGAGLGGGSSDAAFTLRSLNQLFDLGLERPELLSYARQLGSDCAFFVQNQAQFCYERGDHFRAIDLDLSDYHLVLVYPQLHISTQEAYQHIVPQLPPRPLSEVISLPLADWKEKLWNDFEACLFPKYTLLPKLKATLYEKGAHYASMTGSGSSLYGFFEEEVDLDGVFPEDYFVWQGHLAKS